MRFIMVNGRTPRTQSACVLCEKPLSTGYLREIGTQLTYCNYRCYADHCDSATQLLESRQRHHEALPAGESCTAGGTSK
jgi:hypothetical protein